MSNAATEPWFDETQKVDALFKVLRHVATYPEDGLSCVGDDTKANDLFKTAGGIDVPTAEGARVVFLKPGEKALLFGGSVIIEVPPRRISGVSDLQLMNYILSWYPYWPPGSQNALANLINWDIDRRRQR
jgi:hypothetical protein